MDDEATTTQPPAAHDTDATAPEDDARASRSSSPEEVARELISFLSQLSPFRIRSSHTDR
ncbi:MAG: hypothetical protein PVF51_07915 [Nitrospirota bacterium]|jgi:hypothetical protein